MYIFSYRKGFYLTAWIPCDHNGYLLHKRNEFFKHTLFTCKVIECLMYFISAIYQKITSAIIGIFACLEHCRKIKFIAKFQEMGFGCYKFEFWNRYIIIF